MWWLVLGWLRRCTGLLGTLGSNLLDYGQDTCCSKIHSEKWGSGITQTWQYLPGFCPSFCDCTLSNKDSPYTSFNSTGLGDWCKANQIVYAAMVVVVYPEDDKLAR